MIRRVTTRPQSGNRCGHGQRYRCTTNGCPREVFAHNASRLARPGWWLLRRALPAPLEELAHSGRTLHRRRHDVLAYFDHNASNGPTEAINGRLEALPNPLTPALRQPRPGRSMHSNSGRTG